MVIHLGSSFALELQAGGARITKLKDGETVSPKAFINGQINIRYKFDNGYIIKENAHVAPYIFVGAGVSELSNGSTKGGTTNGNVGGGIGLNLWLWKDLSLFVQTSYENMLKSDQNPKAYLQHSAGFAVRFGMKDTDKDGIPDEEDACPTDPGPASTNGCPDKDGDGVPDKVDRCPDQPGSAALNGCPDSDGDGVADIDDRCPTQAGPKELKGCPDRDGDGVADIDDRCPDQKGPAQFKGCPDTDGDGIPDIDDACPTQKGLPQFKGCPDSDGDGIPDNQDRCPNQAGPASNGGCPEPTVEEINKINLSAKSINFQTGKATIVKTSYPVLDVIEEIMNNYPTTKWEIDGHTDNVGKPDKNMALSQARAKAVADYFVSKGISADRLTEQGFGDTKPIADNKTSKGRAQNRRTEIKMVEQNGQKQ